MSQNVWQKRQRQCDAPFLWSVKTINIGYSRSAKEHAQSLSPSSYWEVVQRCREFALVRTENCTLQMITRGAVKEKPWHLISVSSMETRSFLILWIGTGQTQCRNTLHKKSRNNHDRLPSEHYHYPSSTKDAKKNMRRFELNPNKIFVDDWMTFSLAHMWYFHLPKAHRGTLASTWEGFTILAPLGSMRDESVVCLYAPWQWNRYLVKVTWSAIKHQQIPVAGPSQKSKREKNRRILHSECSSKGQS